MATSRFHEKPYDEGTLTKLKIFELYLQEWIPVFTSRAVPSFVEIHIFDFFSGPGTDSEGTYGSPLRILDQLRRYQRLGMAGWSKVRIVVHLFDAQKSKIETLKEILAGSSWSVPGVELDVQVMEFKEALKVYRSVFENPSIAKLLIIDQYGVDEVTDDVFKKLIGFPRLISFFSFPPPLCIGSAIIRQSR